MLRGTAARIQPDEAAKMSREELRATFLAFVAGLVADADRYLARDHVDPTRDGAAFSLAGLWLDDGELLEFLRDLYTVVQPRAANAPRPGRSRRILATVLLPGEQADPEPPTP